MALTYKGLETLIKDKIAQSIQSSSNETLLGFLDIDEDTQDLVIETIRNHPLEKLWSGEGMFFQFLLRNTPATACYGLSVAAAIGLQEEDSEGDGVEDHLGFGGFYSAWKKVFGFAPENDQRGNLAATFISSLRELGLKAGTIYPEKPLHHKGGCYLFHGAILPHYINQLHDALNRLRKHPLPDTAHPEQVKEFALRLAQKVQKGRLKKTLESEAGSILVSRLVRWCKTGDESLFPPHVSELLETEEGQKHFPRPKPAFLSFDTYSEDLCLCLPKQNSEVASNSSTWEVPSLPSLLSLNERHPIPLSELPSLPPKFDVKLTGLSGQSDKTYGFYNGIDPQIGFRIFDASNGYERTFNTKTTQVELAENKDYLLLFDATCSVSGQQVPQPMQCGSASGWQYLTFTAKAGSVVDVSRGNIKWTLSPRTKAGIYFIRNQIDVFQVKRLADDSRLRVYYGAGFNISCVVPSHLMSGAKLTFLHPTLGVEQVNLGPLATQASPGLVDVSRDFNAWLQTLPDAIHEITLRLEYGNRRRVEELVYWKGLDRISALGDFLCTTLPKNLIAERGFSRKNNDLRRTIGRPVLKVKVGAANEEWEMPSNRVQIVVSESDGSRQEIEEGGTLDVRPKEDRLVHFHTGGLLPVELLENGRVICTLSERKPSVSLFLSGLSQNSIGQIDAQFVSSVGVPEPYPLLKWRKPSIADTCTYDAGDVSTWTFERIGNSNTSSFGIHITKLNGVFSGSCLIPSGNTQPLFTFASTELYEESLKPGIICRVIPCDSSRDVSVEISIDDSAEHGSIWLAGIYCRETNSQIWEPVCCREKFGLSKAQLILQKPLNGQNPDEASQVLFWNNTLSHSPLTNAVLDSWLSIARELFGWKFPSVVWRQNQPLVESLYKVLSEKAFVLGTLESKQVWQKHALDNLCAHANSHSDVRKPLLLTSSAPSMAAQSLITGPTATGTKAKTMIEACFETASSYDLLNAQNLTDLNNWGGTFGRDLSENFLPLFYKTKPPFKQINGYLRFFDFPFQTWTQSLLKDCEQDVLSNDDLLSYTHFVRCLESLQHRADQLVNIIQQPGAGEETRGAWLRPFITNVKAQLSHVRSAIWTIEPKLKSSLQGLGSDDCDLESCGMWPIKQVQFLATYPDRELINGIAAHCCLIAFALRSRAVVRIDDARMLSMLRLLIPNQNQQSLEQQMNLVLGTAPELFAFYYLFFTLTITPSYELGN